MAQRKVPIIENTRRFCRMLCDFNFQGLWHQFRRALGLRGPVPEPEMPELDELIYADADLPAGVFSKVLPFRILIFSHDLNLEGASISLFEMISALRKKGVVDPEVIALEDGPLRGRYEIAGIPISVLLCDSDKLSTVKRLNKEVHSLAEAIRQKNPCVVFANTLRSFLAILAAKQAGIPSIWNLRESASWDTFFSYLPDPVAQQAITAIYLPYRVIFVSHASRRIWDRFNRYGNFDVIHTAIDLSRFPKTRDPSERVRARVSLGLKDDTVVVLCVGTINARKAQNDLVEAVAHLPKVASERTQVLLVGDDRDPYAKKLKQRCRALFPDILGKIRFFSSTESVQRFYEAADIFVLCSREESFPRVILEAMAFGIPILTTPVNGAAEQVVEGKNAFFYAEGKIEDLAEKIGSLVQNETLRKQMGLSSLRRLSELTIFDEMTDAYAAVFRAAAKK